MWDVACLLDGRGVQRGSVVGDLAPVAGVDGAAVQTNVTIGDPGEGGGHAEVIDETMPGRVVAGVVIEMVFEAGGLVTPDGSAGGARRDRSEYVEVELGGLIRELQDALGSGAVESGVELADGGGELETIGGGGGQCRRTVLFMLIEVAEAGSGGGFGVAGAEELLVSGVELIGASADGGLVASGPTAGDLLVELGLGRGDVVFRSSASAGGRRAPGCGRCRGRS